MRKGLIHQLPHLHHLQLLLHHLLQQNPHQLLLLLQPKPLHERFLLPKSAPKKSLRQELQASHLHPLLLPEYPNPVASPHLLPRSLNQAANLGSNILLLLLLLLLQRFRWAELRAAHSKHRLTNDQANQPRAALLPLPLPRLLRLPLQCLITHPSCSPRCHPLKALWSHW